jgi:hypothetical protein
MSDLVDEMRAAGELAEHGGDRATSEVRTLADLGLTRQRVAEWRSLRRLLQAELVVDEHSRRRPRPPFLRMAVPPSVGTAAAAFATWRDNA